MTERAEGADLADLLASGEQAVFHGAPGAAVDPLRAAIDAARAAGLGAEGMAATWLLGVALIALGRYGSAIDLLEPMAGSGPAAPPEQRLFASLAGSTLAGLHRQLGRYDAAREADTAALALSGQAGEAGFDAALGLVADAVALDGAAGAREHLDRAAAMMPGGWRQRIRLDWIRAEVALAAGAPTVAADHAHDAVAGAETARAPWHLARGLILLGMAQSPAAQQEAEHALRRAAVLAEGLAALPLVWPARSALAALLSARDPEAAEASRAAARLAVRGIAEGLPPSLRGQWLARPEVDGLHPY